MHMFNKLIQYLAKAFKKANVFLLLLAMFFSSTSPFYIQNPRILADGTPPGTDMDKLEAGRFHSCYINSSGAVLCWGNNNTGQIGNGNTTSPQIVPVTVIASGATAVSAGSAHTCALVAGAVKCWGDNNYGQTGSGDTVSPQLTPVTVIASGATAISAGNSHSCAVVAGAVKCWGHNYYGQTGSGNTVTPQLTPVTAIASGATAVAVGAYHTCALVTGAVKCWGWNEYGQTGNGNTISPQLSPVTTIASGVTAVSSGALHNCAVVSGALQCWGYNWDGEIGNGSATAPKLLPLTVIVSGVTAVAAGEYYTCAIETGAVKCWGTNSQGESGSGNTTTPQLAQVTVIASGATAVAAGYWHSCAIVSGAPQCWGYNAYGQIGNGNAISPQLIPVAVAFAAVPAAPNSIALNSPATSPGNNTTPILTVGGVVSGDTVRIFTDGSCTTAVGSAVAAGTTVNVTASALAQGSYTFKANSTNLTGSSTCSSVTAAYVLDTSEPTTTVNITNAVYSHITFVDASTINGTASDTGGATLASVAITMQRSGDSKYFTGSSWGALTWLPASGTTAWTYAINHLTNMSLGYTYNIIARATDTAGNVTTSVFGSDNFQYANATPNIISAWLNLGMPIELTAGTTKAINAQSTVVDNDGYADIDTVTAKVYRSGVAGGSACTANNNNCYAVSCIKDVPSCAGNSCNFNCGVDFQYYADATDTASPYPSETWLATFTATDSQSASWNSTSSGIELNSLLSFITTTTINYGVMLPNSHTGAVNQPLNIINDGNVLVNLLISGTDICNGLNCIPVNNSKYSTSTFTYSSGGINLSSTPTALTMNLAKATSAYIYLGQAIPVGIAQNTYTGTITLTAN